MFSSAPRVKLTRIHSSRTWRAAQCGRSRFSDDPDGWTLADLGKSTSRAPRPLWAPRPKWFVISLTTALTPRHQGVFATKFYTKSTKIARKNRTRHIHTTTLFSPFFFGHGTRAQSPPELLLAPCVPVNAAGYEGHPTELGDFRRSYFHAKRPPTASQPPSLNNLANLLASLGTLPGADSHCEILLRADEVLPACNPKFNGQGSCIGGVHWSIRYQVFHLNKYKERKRC